MAERQRQSLPHNEWNLDEPRLPPTRWRVTRVEPGLAESTLPLNPQSTNQHFTHQAAFFLLAADYTGGIAVGSLLTGWPVASARVLPAIPVAEREGLPIT